MLLFIFESIGTQELILIGVIALIFLGPRKLPEYAHKIGKMMAEFRGTANEFKQTWEREVNFEEESRSLRLDSIEAESEADAPAARTKAPTGEAPANSIAPPAIKAIDPATIAGAPKNEIHEEEPPSTIEPKEDVHDERLEKHNWL